jgi:Spy/CpxP family protein refolding chaperone
MNYATIIVGMSLLASSAVWVHAGHGDKYGMYHHGDMPSIEERVDKKMEKMTKNLDLTPEQQTAIRAILQQKFEEGQKVHEEVREKMKALHDTTQSAIQAELTPEQKEKYEAQKKEWEEKWEKKDKKKDKKDRKKKDKKK